MQTCLLQRLVAALATNEGVQPKRTEIWQRLKSLTPREVDVLCHVLGGQINREIAVECNRLVKHRVDSRDGVGFRQGELVNGFERAIRAHGHGQGRFIEAAKVG